MRFVQFFLEMGKNKQLSKTFNIDFFHDEGLSNRFVVRNYLRNKDSYGKNYKRGISKALTTFQERKIPWIASNSKLCTAKIVHKDEVSVSKSIVRRVILSAEHLKLRKLQKQPPLNPTRRQQRLDFAKDHLTSNFGNHYRDDWRKVVFTRPKHHWKRLRLAHSQGVWRKKAVRRHSFLNWWNQICLNKISPNYLTYLYDPLLLSNAYSNSYF